jgi:hypothetical protein
VCTPRHQFDLKLVLSSEQSRAETLASFEVEFQLVEARRSYLADTMSFTDRTEESGDAIPAFSA